MLIVTSSGTDKKLEIDRKLENKLEIYKNLKIKLEIYSYFKLKNKLEIFEFFVNGRWSQNKPSLKKWGFKFCGEKSILNLFHVLRYLKDEILNIFRKNK